MRESYKPIEIDFISLFKRFAYRNIYFYNLIDYFLKYIYLYSIVGNSKDNVIILFDYYL